MEQNRALDASLQVIRLLPRGLRQRFQALPESVLERLEEIRLRPERPVQIVTAGRDWFLDASGRPVAEPVSARTGLSRDSFSRTLQAASESSLYALSEEIKNGFITVDGGHRIGLVGRSLVEDGRVKTLKDFGAMNLRICREVIGAADDVVEAVVSLSGARPYVRNTLIYGPPGCGKTTLLRDLIRQLSRGRRGRFRGFVVGVVDERSEIGGAVKGLPQNDLGPRTDLIDACPKDQGMMMLLRAMSPAVIATDEVGGAGDAQALNEVLHAGISIIATAHASDEEQLISRPHLGELVQRGLFERLIQMSFRQGVGTIDSVSRPGEIAQKGAHPEADGGTVGDRMRSGNRMTAAGWMKVGDRGGGWR